MSSGPSADPGALFAAGVEAFQAGRSDEAARLFEEVTRLLPDHPAPWSNLGNARLAHGDAKAAVTAHRRAIELDPSNAEAHYNLGAALRRDGHTHLAVVAYRAAIARGLDTHASWNNLGIALKDDGRLGEAEEAYRRALALAPGDAAVHLNLGNALGDRGNVNEAIDCYRAALAIDPALAEAHLGMFAALFDESDPSSALAHLEQALVARPEHEGARFQLGVHAARSGDGSRASRWLEALPAHLRSSADFVAAHAAPVFTDSFRLIDHALSLASVEGLVIEVGVRHGTSVGHIARRVGRQVRVHGFDSFEGLPEVWGGQPVGLYSTQGVLPEVPENVELHVGFFDATLPSFALDHAGPVRFLNVDCDLYRSTVDVFATLGSRLVPGSIVVFDEYLANPGWEDEEHRAWLETVAAHQLDFEYIAFGPFTRQAAIRVR